MSVVALRFLPRGTIGRNPPHGQQSLPQGCRRQAQRIPYGRQLDLSYRDASRRSHSRTASTSATVAEADGDNWHQDDAGAVGGGLRPVPSVWGQAACRRRTQPAITFQLEPGWPAAAAEAPGVVAVCRGYSFCGKQAEGHHFLCECTPGDERRLPSQRIALQNPTGAASVLEGSGVLEPGQWKVKFEKMDGEAEVLQGWFGVEEFRPLTVLPPPHQDAVLLVTDIDGTLLGRHDDEHAHHAAEKFFWVWNDQYKGRRGAHLVYNTGRPFGSAHSLIKEGRLQPPSALVCSEGTEIFWFGPFGGDHVDADDEWREILMLSWDYDQVKAGVERIVQEMQHRVSEEIETLFLYEENGQPMVVVKNLFDQGEADAVLGEIHELRDASPHGFEVNMTHSYSGFNILIVPQGANKGSAARHVARRLGIAPDQVMVAGDGANDVPLFEATVDSAGQGGFKGVLVGNAGDELKGWASRSPSDHRIHRATGQHAHGVLEGLQQHFG